MNFWNRFLDAIAVSGYTGAWRYQQPRPASTYTTITIKRKPRYRSMWIRGRE